LGINKSYLKFSKKYYREMLSELILLFIFADENT